METDRTAPVTAAYTVSRRRALQGIGGGIAASMLIAAATRGEEALPPPSQVREFVLEAQELSWELMPGVPVTAWGYNGQVPGPEIRVTEGDLVRVVLRNRLSVPTTVHWHGVHLKPAMDGPAGLNQAAVPPGEEFIYEFTATPAGTRWYHSHADPQLQVSMGLYGPLIIEPKVPTRPYSYDREYTLILGEWDNELTPAVAAGREERGPRDRSLRGGELGSDFFLMNGKAHGAIPPIVLAEGEKILLRVINAGHHAHPIHIHGHTFKLVATDGNPIPMGMEWLKDTVLVGPAERYDLELDGNNPGVWMVHCHIEHHMANGMMTVLQYEGEVPTGPAAELFGDVMTTDSAGQGSTEHSHTPSTPEPVAPVEPATQGTAGKFEFSMIDDRFYPVTMTVPVGSTVTWVNNGADWHNVASSAAGFDSGRVAPGEAFSFTFEVAGTYRFVCRHHGLAGMNGEVVVT
jgi:FtsP/CotA-like multicopper oxidase with cupredoxin domain/plastocyanin